ncbi:hypothetical protein KKH13_02215, partial [Patescibacteria group bacterium]|nr:hypothetical protein [Patescibacteria group bacterium]
GGDWNFATDQVTGGPATPATIINAVLPFVFVIAGLALFLMFFFGGFTIFVSAGNPEKIKQGQQMLVNALIGFAVIFAAYWIIELLQFSLGFKAL